MKQTADTRKPYTGSTRSFVLAIDVGTTFSGVSYAILEPGEIPKIHGVTRFPGHDVGNSKIPSVMYYDKTGKVMAAGAEAEMALSQAEDEEWIKTELFKLRLRPRTMKLNMNGMRLGPLPQGKTAVHVFGDFLSYMYKCTRTFVMETHGNGKALWKAVEHDIQFVLSHPNGWEGAQQTKMRRAAVYGGLIPDTNEGRARIRFVTEGEASLHACVLNGLASDVLSNEQKSGFLVADAGGGTLDISSYTIVGQNPLVIEEVAPPDCIFAGSVFVSRRAREFLKEKLKKSKYGSSDSLDHITKRFDETTKRHFRNKADTQFIAFGSPLDKDPSVGIRSGQLKLTGSEVADLFEPSIKAALAAIKAQIDASKGNIKSVFLVGGYAASPWLFTQLQERLAKYRVSVSRPDTATSKAVADGAIGFYCDHHVSARVAKFMYGVEYLRAYNAEDQDHVARKDRLTELPSGPKLLADAFDCILARGVKVKESTVFTRKYCTELTNLSMLSVFEVEIWCYRGGNQVPLWIERHAEDFSTLCLVRADLSPLSGIVESKVGRDGRSYWTIVFSIEIHFGLTEFKARIKWLDNGVVKYGPASIIYNERGHRVDEDEPDSNSDDDMSVDLDRSRSVMSSRAPSVDPRQAPEPVIQPVKPPSSSRGGKTPKIPDVVHAPPSGTQTPLPAEPEQRSRGLESSSSLASRGRTKEKGKGKERDSVHTTDTTSTRSSSMAKIGETLSSVWGPAQSEASPKEGRPRLDSVAEVPSVREIAASSPPPPADTSRSLGLSPSLSSNRVSSSGRKSSVPSAAPSAAPVAHSSHNASAAASPKISSPTPPAPQPAVVAPILESARSPVIAPLSPGNMLSGTTPWSTSDKEPEKPADSGSLFGNGGLFSSLAAPAVAAAEASGAGFLSGLWGGKAPSAKAATPKLSGTPKPGSTPKADAMSVPDPEPVAPSSRSVAPSHPPSPRPAPADSAAAPAASSKQPTPRPGPLTLDSEAAGRASPKPPGSFSPLAKSKAGTPNLPLSPLSKSTFPSPKLDFSALAQDTASAEQSSSNDPPPAASAKPSPKPEVAELEAPPAPEAAPVAESSSAAKAEPEAAPEPPAPTPSSKKSSRKSSLKQAMKKESTPAVAASVALPASSLASAVPSPKPSKQTLEEKAPTPAGAASVALPTSTVASAVPSPKPVERELSVPAASKPASRAPSPKPSPKPETTPLADAPTETPPPPSDEAPPAVPEQYATTETAATSDPAPEPTPPTATELLSTDTPAEAQPEEATPAAEAPVEASGEVAAEVSEKANSPLKLNTDLPATTSGPVSSVPMTAATTAGEEEEEKEKEDDPWGTTKKGKKKGGKKKGKK